MNTPFSKKSGFTIVELTLVIVVLAILFSITAVAYVGVQKEARNSQTAAAVTQYRDALILYRTVNKKYPSTPELISGTSYCLGKEYQNNTCWYTKAVDSTATNLLEQISGGKMNMPANLAGKPRGIVYYPEGIASLDAKPSAFIAYAIEGDEKCPVGPVTSSTDTWGLIHSSNPPASGQTRPVDADGFTQCWLSLPNK